MERTTLIILILIAVNTITFLAFAVDKANAKKGNWRIPDNVLLFWSIFAPWGSCIGMKVMNHKTKHNKFTLLVPSFMMLHIVLLIAII